MFKTNRQSNENLDRAGKVILRSAAAAEEDIEAAASSPFLLTRVRAAINQAQRAREETGSWLSLFLVARSAVPAMVLIAGLTALLTLLSTGASSPVNARFVDDELIYGSRDGSVEQSVLADNSSLSGDDVFSLIVERGDRETR
jgi:hypothetical protein